MSGRSSSRYVKRRRVIRGYANFTIAAAEHVIEHLTESTYKYALEFYHKRITTRTGRLLRGYSWDVRGKVGLVKNTDQKAHLLEYGVPAHNQKPRPTLRPGKNKAMREIKGEWKQSLQEAYTQEKNK